MYLEADGGVSVLAAAGRGASLIRDCLTGGALDGVQGLEGQVWREVAGACQRYSHALLAGLNRPGGWDERGGGQLEACRCAVASIHHLLEAAGKAGGGRQEASPTCEVLSRSLCDAVACYRAWWMRSLGASLLGPMSSLMWKSGRALLKRDEAAASHSLRHALVMVRGIGRGLQPRMGAAVKSAVASELAPAITAVLVRATPSVQNMRLFVTDCNMAASLLASLAGEDSAHAVENAVNALKGASFLKAAPLQVIEANLGRIEGAVGGEDDMQLATPGKAPPRHAGGGVMGGEDCAGAGGVAVALAWGEAGARAGGEGGAFLAAASSVASDDTGPWGQGGESLGEGAWRFVRAGSFARACISSRPELGGGVLFPPLPEQDVQCAGRLKLWLDGQQ